MVINYWLLKTEPHTYSWDDFVKLKIDMWNGVRNFTARNNLRSMKAEDLCFFYHSGAEPAIVGIAKVVKEHYPDPTAKEGKWSVVDVAAVQPLNRPVTLKEIKNEKSLQDMVLVKLSRLSVQPVTEFEFYKILDMGNTKL
jgi:predicted RNA-binding protein with PUA-like domain